MKLFSSFLILLFSMLVLACANPLIETNKAINKFFAPENADYQPIKVNEENELMIWRIGVLIKSDCSINNKNRCVSLQKK